MKFFIGLLFLCQEGFLENALHASGRLSSKEVIQNVPTDVLYDAKNLWKNGKVLELKQLLEKAYKDNDQNYDILCMLSQTYLVYISYLDKDEKKIAFLHKAIRILNKAIKINPSKSKAYMYRAAAKASIAKFQGIFEVSRMVNESAEDARKGIKLKSGKKEILAMGYYILGRTNFELAKVAGVLRFPFGLGWGNMDDAMENFEKSLSLYPKAILHLLSYAIALVDMGRTQEAKSVLKECLNAPLANPGDKEKKKQAKKLLNKISR